MQVCFLLLNLFTNLITSAFNVNGSTQLCHIFRASLPPSFGGATGSASTYWAKVSATCALLVVAPFSSCTAPLLSGAVAPGHNSCQKEAEGKMIGWNRCALMHPDADYCLTSDTKSQKHLKQTKSMFNSICCNRMVINSQISKWTIAWQMDNQKTKKTHVFPFPGFHDGFGCNPEKCEFWKPQPPPNSISLEKRAVLETRLLCALFQKSHLRLTKSTT